MSNFSQSTHLVEGYDVIRSYSFVTNGLFKCDNNEFPSLKSTPYFPMGQSVRLLQTAIQPKACENMKVIIVIIEFFKLNIISYLMYAVPMHAS